MGRLPAGALSARYSDAFFENPSDQYAPGLAQASLLFAAAAFTAADSAASYGEDGWCGREAELERVFQAAGFRNAEFFGYDRSLNDSGDQAAFGIAEKSILAHGKAEKLVAVAVRGGGYGCEWVSNMHVSVLLPWHMGFGAAAQQVYEELQDYLKRHQLEDPLLWITGFSRGAAVANLTAGLLNENGFDAGRLYAYTFATPNCTTVPAYTNIFNIVGDADAVADIPLRQWGFSKHGVTKTFTDTQAHSADNIAQKNALIGALERAVPQREIYCSSLQAVLMGYMQCANTRFLNESGVWEQKSLTDTFAALYGEEGKQALALARQNSLLRILQRTAPAVSEYVTVVIALCLANECEITSSITSLLIDPAVHQLLFNSGLVTKAHDPAVYMQALEHIR